MPVVRAAVRLLDRLALAGQRLVVAASGGPDSTALLVAAAEEGPRRGVPVTAAYVNHGLRPEAAREGELVRALATRIGADFRLLGGDARAEASRLRTSCQDGARVLRYRLLAELARAEGLGFVATAHTADDQAETVVLRLLRGAGLPGLAGVLPERPLAPGVTLVRPFLGVRRAEALAFLVARGLAGAVVRDPSNEDPRYARARVRAELMPLFAREDPRMVEQLAALAADARATAALLAGMAEARLLAYGGASPGAPFPAAAVAGAPDAVRPFVVRAAVARAMGPAAARRLGRAHIEALERLCADQRGTAEATLPGGWRAVRVYGLVELTSAAARPAPARGPAFPGGDLSASPAPGAEPVPRELAIHGPGEHDLPWAVDRFSRVRVTRTVAPEAPPEVLLLRETWPLVFRPRRAGERLKLAGRRTRRLQDLFVDARIPRAERDAVPIVSAGAGAAEVLAVAGLGPAQGAIPAPGTAALALWFSRKTA